MKKRRTPSFLRASSVGLPAAAPEPKPMPRNPEVAPLPQPLPVLPPVAAVPKNPPAAAANTLIIKDRERVEKITKDESNSSILYAIGIFLIIFAIALFVMGTRKGGNCTKVKRCRVKHSYNTAEIIKSACGGEDPLAKGYCQGDNCPEMQFGDNAGKKASTIEDLSTVMIEKLRDFEFDPKKFKETK